MEHLEGTEVVTVVIGHLNVPVKRDFIAIRN